MQYAEFRPAVDLQPWVDRYWQICDPCPGADAQPVLADGPAEWVVHLATPFAGQAACLYVGQMTGPVYLRPAGPLSAFGVRFRPRGVWAFCRLPQSDLRDRIVPLNELVRAREWRERLATSTDAPAATDAFLRSLLQDRPNHRLDRAARSTPESPSACLRAVPKIPA